MNKKIQALKNKRIAKQEQKEAEQKQIEQNNLEQINSEMPPPNNMSPPDNSNQIIQGGISESSASAFYAISKNQNQNIVADDDARVDMVCDDCGKRTIRHKGSEGTLVCIDCGLVAQSSVIDMTNETRNFSAENAQNATVSRTGDLIRMDQMNYLITEFTGNKYSGAKQANALQMRSSGESHIISTKKKRDWYRDYFNTIKKKLKIKSVAVDLAMSKVEKVLEAKNKGMPLTGSREAYACNIMHIVSNELELEIKMQTIQRFTPGLQPSQISKAYKKLNKIFKEWYKTTKTPHSLLPQYCQKLKYPPELVEDAVYIAKQIHKRGTLEGCQPLTIVGVSLYILNSRLGNKQDGLSKEYQQFCKREDELAAVVTKGPQTIQHAFGRIKDDVLFMIPDKYLTSRERAKKDHELKLNSQIQYQQQRQQDQSGEQQYQEVQYDLQSLPHSNGQHGNQRQYPGQYENWQQHPQN